MNYESEIISELPKGLICWYEFQVSAKILQITKEKNILTEYLMQQDLEVDCISARELLQRNTHQSAVYDYILAVDVLETCGDAESLLHICRQLLKADGVLLLGTDNRLGLRYFCGDRDPFTKRNFDGIENYRRADLAKDKTMRCYSQSEIRAFLENASFLSNRFYSVLPNVNSPQLIFAEDFLPNEELAARYFPMYHNPDTVFMEEEYLYTSLIENGMFHAMANTYFIECAPVDKLSNVIHVTLSLDRGPVDALATIIRRDDKVEKRAIYPEGKRRLQEILQHDRDLCEHGIQVVSAVMENDSYVMPYMSGELASTYLRRIAQEDKELFIKEMERFLHLILSSSEILREDDEDGVILKNGYFDLVPLNCFYVNGQFVFYDQEFCLEEYPANVMITRSINMVYQNDNLIESILPKKFFFDKYGIKDNGIKWNQMQMDFLIHLRKEIELRVFYEQNRRNLQVVHTNRQRINYSDVEYQRLFVDIFEGLEKKKLVLFGAGNFTKKFIALYGQKYPIHMIIDNNSDKWGSTLEGVIIQSPNMLLEMDKEEYKVIICIKNYPSVLQQMRDVGVKYVGIYDVNKDYHLPEERQVVTFPKEDEVPKKYHIGYTCGVYDLFHIGHLNMFKRAKEQCDYLIVGVVTDEGACKFKKKEPFIPFEERIEMVRSCKYVDEAVEIPVNFGGTRDAYRLYHFDVQFSGSDYENDPVWLAEREYLRKHGSDLVFFPYTEQTSSTKIKALINKHLF